MFRDRQVECRSFDRMMEAVGAGESRALVVLGEAGAGKTALLEHFGRSARRCRVVRATGVQSEIELAFAGVHQLCSPLLAGMAALPISQREALGTAFGLAAGNPPDRFLVGLAVLGLLAEAARERPLLCLVDDIQWVDRASAQTLTFVARRLGAESVALVFAARDRTPGLTGIPEMRLAGLPEEDALELLRASFPGPVDEQVVARIVAEARGNPLALSELPRGFTAAELVPGAGLGTPLPYRVEQSFRRRLVCLPTDTRRLLEVAAAEPLGDPVLLWLAAGRLGLWLEAATPAEAAGLVELGTRVRFRHPLVRAVIYRDTPPARRRAAHRALAEVTDVVRDPDRQAWHRAQATTGPDEHVAADLERSAGRAQARGGLAAAAAFLHRAVELTPEPGRRGERALAAGRAGLRAGMPEWAVRLLAVAEASRPGECGRAQADLLRAQIEVTLSRGGDAPRYLVNAKRLEAFDPLLARDTYLDALMAAWFAAHLARQVGVREVARAARTAPRPPEPPRPADVLLDAMATRFSAGFSAGAPLLRQAVRSFLEQQPAVEPDLGLLWFGYIGVAADLWDDASLAALSGRFLQRAQRRGARAAADRTDGGHLVAHLRRGTRDRGRARGRAGDGHRGDRYSRRVRWHDSPRRLPRL